MQVSELRHFGNPKSNLTIVRTTIKTAMDQAQNGSPLIQHLIFVVIDAPKGYDASASLSTQMWEEFINKYNLQNARDLVGKPVDVIFVGRRIRDLAPIGFFH